MTQTSLFEDLGTEHPDTPPEVITGTPELASVAVDDDDESPEDWGYEYPEETPSVVAPQEQPAPDTEEVKPKRTRKPSTPREPKKPPPTLDELIDAAIASKTWLPECDYKLILTEDDWYAWKKDAPAKCVLDVETEGLNRYKHKIVGIALSYQEKTGVYIPIRHVVNNFQGDPQWVLDEVEEFFSTRTCIMHNAKFDLDFLDNEGVHIRKYEDTIVSIYLNDSNSKNKGLKESTSKFLGIDMIKLETFFDKKEKERNFSKVDPIKAVPYACADSDMTMRLYNLFETVREAQSYIYKLETVLIDVIRRMENNRIALDADYLARIPEHIDYLMVKHRKIIYDMVGHEFDIMSTQQLSVELLALGLTLEKSVPKEKKVNPNAKPSTRKAAPPKDGYKTDEVSLKKLGHPIAEHILEFRHLNKTLSTYIIHLYKAAALEGVARFKFNQFVASTGRFSSGSKSDQDENMAKTSKSIKDDGFTPVNAQNIPSVDGAEWFKAMRVTTRRLKETGQAVFVDKPRTINADQWQAKLEGKDLNAEDEDED